VSEKAKAWLTFWVALIVVTIATAFLVFPVLGMSPMDEARKLIERLVGKLSSVERDTHYGIHEPYAHVWPDIATNPAFQCTCALCAGREYLAKGASND
jgi:hypothetical protein